MLQLWLQYHCWKFTRLTETRTVNSDCWIVQPIFIFPLEQVIYENNWPAFERYSVFIVISCVWLGILCNVGDETTTHFLKIADEMHACPWHDLPDKLKQYFSYMITMAQKPVYIQGMGQNAHAKHSKRCLRTIFFLLNVTPTFFIIRMLYNFGSSILDSHILLSLDNRWSNKNDSYKHI